VIKIRNSKQGGNIFDYLTDSFGRWFDTTIGFRLSSFKESERNSVFSRLKPLRRGQDDGSKVGFGRFWGAG
jgi:hypothetical protein